MILSTASVPLLGLCILLALSVGYTWTANRLNPYEKQQKQGWIARFGLATLYLWALCGLEWVIGLPLPLFYLLLWGYLILIPLNKTLGARTKFLHVNIFFICLTAEHLLVLGIVALAVGHNALYLLGYPLWRGLSVLLILSLNCISNLVISRAGITGANLYGNTDHNELAVMALFTWLSALFTILQGIPCLFDLPYALTSLFLIGSNLLMLMLLFLFNNHTISILKKRYLEDEYWRLEQARQEAEQRKDQLAETVHTDPLTKAATRQCAQEQIVALMGQGLPFSLGFLDLDHLKDVNDREGHEQGDRYLSAFADRFRAKLRDNDVFARVGGDEFVVVMPDCSADVAQKRLLAIQSELSVSGTGGRPVPFSFGVSTWSQESELTAEELLSLADHLMYQDKQLRRKHFLEGGAQL